MQIEITENEKKLILDALVHPAYKDKVALPKTPQAIRQSYKALIRKLIKAKGVATPQVGPIRRFLLNLTLKLLLPGEDN